MKVTASLYNLRISPRKSKLVADLIKGQDIDKAIEQLDITIKRSSAHVKKLLESAIANAENNFGLSRGNLYVFDAIVGAGPTLKRWMPKAYGRAGKILKRTSNIKIVLEERVEGKDRKTKEQLEKERKERLEIKKKEEKARKEEGEKQEKDETKNEPSFAKITEEKEKLKDGGKKSWTNKIFRRKSM